MQLRKFWQCTAPFVFSLALASCGEEVNNNNEPEAGNCRDEIDNDGNGQTDCDDAACAADPVCIESVCDDNLDNDGDGGFDCNDDECAANAACTVAASSASVPMDGIVAAQDPSFANGSAAFEIGETDLGGGAIFAAMVVIASDQVDTCAAVQAGLADAKLAIVAVLSQEASVFEPLPAADLGFFLDATLGGVFVSYSGLVVSGGVTNVSAQSDFQASEVNILKIGADNLVSVQGNASLIFEVTDTANFNFDVNNDGTNDGKAIDPPAALSIDVKNASGCTGLLAAVGF